MEPYESLKSRLGNPECRSSLGPVPPEPTLAALRRDRSRSVAARLAFCDRKWREDAANFVTVK